MSRVYYLRDARGDREVAEAALPLQFGGAGPCDLVVPGVDENVVAGYIALADGRPYLQPAGDAVVLYHNHERVDGSRWLKSGDRVQVGAAGTLLWQVKGDQVFVTAERFVPPTAESSVPLATTRSPQAELLGTVGDAPAPVPARRGRRVVLGGLLAGLALVALFLLLAVPVQIEIEPLPETRSLDGLLPGAPGEHETPNGLLVISPFRTERFGTMQAVTELFHVGTAAPRYADLLEADVAVAVVDPGAHDGHERSLLLLSAPSPTAAIR